MKRITLAVCMAFIAATAFSQTQTVGSNNNHGQNDCQCIGIGIPIEFGPSLTSNGSGTKNEPTISVNSEGKKDALSEHGLLYIYYELLMEEIHIKLDAQKGK